MDAISASARSGLPPRGYNAMLMLFCGLGLVLTNAVVLFAQNELLIRSSPFYSVLLVQIAFIIWVPSPRKGSVPGISQRSALTVKIPVSVVTMGVCTVWLVRQTWAAPAIGLAYAVAFVNIGRIVRGRPYYVSAAGWCLAGLASVVLFGAREPAAHFFVIAGAITAFEGAFEYWRR